MSNDKPPVVVSEADRRAAWVALRWRTAYEPAFSGWFATGHLTGEYGDEQEVADLVATAQAIAHARTMAAFEERCAAVRRFLREEPAVLVDVERDNFAACLSEVADVGFGEASVFLRTPGRADDDIRALVLKGWEQ